MDTSIEKILAELVINVSDHFDLEPQDALAAVAQSRVANELSSEGNVHNRSLDQLCQELYDEISKAE